ncbi:GntR family transcriptional regulator [Orrella sp. JC864]|uniref:GntR family transcriptional regulator n=1 Tax=Orrella sp. JC864 TaxID=3120298 RepID=UPI00300BA07F
MKKKRPAAAPVAPLYQAIATAMETAIAQRALKAGDLVNETIIAQAMSVSRTPVKAALEELAARGVLHKHTGRGFVVGRPEQVQRLRRLSAGSIAAFAAQMAPLRTPDSWIGIYDKVELEVCNRSLYGALRIIEAELAKTFGVSRTVAHEVLLRLEGVGLVEKDPAGRWTIVPLTPTRVRQLYEIRRYLEPPALKRSTERIPQHVLAQMWSRLMDVMQRYPDVAEDELDTLERDLHFRCIAYCDNPELMKMLQQNQALLINNKHMLGGYFKLPDMDPFMAEHKLVLEALGRRSAAAAAKALDAHLAASVPKMLKRLELVSSEPPADVPPYMAAIREDDSP